MGQQRASLPNDSNVADAPTASLGYTRLAGWGGQKPFPFCPLSTAIGVGCFSNLEFVS